MPPVDDFSGGKGGMSEKLCNFADDLNEKDMKKSILSIILFAVAAIFTATAQTKVEVSETIELMSILARTAGYEEFSENLGGQYTKDIEAWFAPYKEHAAVAIAKDIRAKHGIGYDRVSNMAVHLDIDRGKVVLVGDRTELNNGWQDTDLDNFVKNVNKFYKDTRFHDFFEQHRTFYDEFIKTYEANLMRKFSSEWYSQFYHGTEPADQFRVVIGFNYGSTNNGAWRQLPGKPRELFSIIGYNFNPTRGRPLLDLTLLYHEFNHSFFNPLLDAAAHAKAMEPVGQKLFQLSKQTMEQQHYNDWSIVINESLVRAAVILKMQDMGFDRQMTLNVMASEMLQKGFPWMLDLVGTLRYYTAHRDKYPSLADFYPEIVRCLEKYVEDEEGRMQNALK